jgi:hypothetical protein
VVTAAYGAFSHGLDLSLLAAGSLMMLSAILALFTGISRHSGSHRFRAPKTAPNDEPEPATS